MSDETRVFVFFGYFVHELAHLVYTGQDVAGLSDGELRYTPMHYDMIHFIEDRRVESKLVKEFPVITIICTQLASWGWPWG